MNTPMLAGILYVIASAGAVFFQVALALGAPWGEYAMGGAFPGRFPLRLRVAAAVQAVVLIALAVVVLAFAGLLLPGLAQAAPWLIWLVVRRRCLPQYDHAPRRRASSVGARHLCDARVQPHRWIVRLIVTFALLEQKEFLT